MQAEEPPLFSSIAFYKYKQPIRRDFEGPLTGALQNTKAATPHQQLCQLEIFWLPLLTARDAEKQCAAECRFAKHTKAEWLAPQRPKPQRSGSVTYMKN